MPKLKVSDKELHNRRVKAILFKNMALYGVTPKQVAIQAGFTETTYYARIKDPSSFRLSELWAICKLLKVTDNERAFVLGGDAANV